MTPNTTLMGEITPNFETLTDGQETWSIKGGCIHGSMNYPQTTTFLHRVL